MKKMIILSPEERKLDDDKVLEFIKFADEHKLIPVGETHYPPMLPIEMPEAFVEILKDRFEDCIYVMDDSCLIFANAYNDGKLVDLLEQNNITIVHKELKSDLKRIFDVMEEDTLIQLKRAVAGTINELGNEREAQIKKIAVFYQNENDNEFNSFIEGLSQSGDTIICAMCIPIYDDCMKEAVKGVLTNNKISEAIIYNKEMGTSDFIECLEELKIDYRYRESDIEMNMSGMYLN